VKVKDLKKGMLIEPLNPNHVLVLNSYTYGSDPLPWVNVIPKKRTRRMPGYPRESADIAMYVGTKKDVKIEMSWSDKFVMINGKIGAVDPSAWSKLSPVS